MSRAAGIDEAFGQQRLERGSIGQLTVRRVFPRDLPATTSVK